MPLLTLQDLEQASLLFHGRIGRMVGRGVMRMLSVDRLNTLYDRNAHLRGPAFAHGVLKELGIEYDVFAETPEVITQLNGLHRGMPFITISNHPYGSIDGVILAGYFGHHCPEYKIMVNQMLGRVEALAPSFIPVTPMNDKNRMPTKESILGLRRALAHLRSGAPLGLFPAGAVSNLCLRGRCICDREWQPSIIRFIAKARVPILPVRFFDGNSLFYYLLGLIDWRIRLLRLPAEVFNKAGRPVRLSIAPLISVEQQEVYLANHTMEEFGLWLRSKVEEMTMGNK